MILHDRGMIKWAPYKSLIEQEDYLLNMLYEKEKKEKPILSEDQLDDLNLKMRNLIEGESVDIKYFKDGYIINIRTNFVKVDPYLSKIYFSDITLSFDDIIEIGMDRIEFY